MRRAARLIMVIVCLHVLTEKLNAATIEFGFENITANNITDADIGEVQLFFRVSAIASDQVAFTFFNDGPEPSTIADIYFDDASGDLSTILDIDNNDPRVSFSMQSRPPVLPGRNNANPSFEVTSGLSAGATAPSGGPNGNGINPNESVSFIIGLSENRTFADVVSSLNNSQLRIGIHVQSFESGGSESFVSVPEPATFSLLALGVLAQLRKRKA